MALVGPRPRVLPRRAIRRCSAHMNQSSWCVARLEDKPPNACLKLTPTRMLRVLLLFCRTPPQRDVLIGGEECCVTAWGGESLENTAWKASHVVFQVTLPSFAQLEVAADRKTAIDLLCAVLNAETGDERVVAASQTGTEGLTRLADALIPIIAVSRDQEESRKLVAKFNPPARRRLS